MPNVMQKHNISVTFHNPVYISSLGPKKTFETSLSLTSEVKVEKVERNLLVLKKQLIHSFSVCLY